MKRKSWATMTALAVLTAACFTTGSAKDADKTKKDPVREKDMAIFHVNVEKNRIDGPVKNLKDYLKFKYYSVTTDQPIYWPNEDVFLKVLMPASPGREVEITVRKKDAAPEKTVKVKLNAAGMLVQTLLSGKNKRLEPGEYRVEVKTADGKISGYTTFSVVEGALGALSFGYEFEQATDAQKLEKLNGAWFMGNAAGVGLRWGNGLNIKNEIRSLNQPYNGDIVLKTRCFLPGCDGVDAGPDQKLTVRNGKLEAVLDVGGHSGPFGIEVITKNGSVSYLFGKSGHVERQTIVVSRGLGKNFSATLAPYENTMPVPGREIYITKDSDSDDPIQINSVIADNDREIELAVKRDFSGAKIVVCYPVADDEFKTEEISVPENWKKGNKIKVKVRSPYSFIGVGGFEKTNYYEGWAIAFAPSGIDSVIEAPTNAAPNRTVDIKITTKNHDTGAGVPVFGILEVFDNRVQSKSAKEPLVSSIGDAVRETANYLVSWRDLTGYDYDDEKRAEEVMDMASANGKPMQRSYAMKSKAAPSPIASMRNGNSTETVEVEQGQDQEEVREGERKVLYCGLVRTDDTGMVNVTVQTPPQTGRLKVRFTAVDKYEYAETVKDVDIAKTSYLEVNVMPLLMPGAKVTVKTSVVNAGKKKVKLVITGAGVERKIEETFGPGAADYTFQVEGRTYGKLELKLTGEDGKTLDRREVELKNIASYPVTFSELIVSDGSSIKIGDGGKIAVYANPGMMMQGMVMDIVTSMYSWFGHVEALSSSAAIRSILLLAMDEKIIEDEGLRDTIKSDLVKTVKDIREVFYDGGSKLFRPYPGLNADMQWSLWTAENLSTAARYLESSAKLKKEFADTVKTIKEMTDDTWRVLNKNGGEAQYNPEKNMEMLPIEINGKVVYRLLTDTAVVDWFLSKMYKNIDMDPRVPLNKAFIIDYDMYRFLRSVERTGEIYYLTQNAKALYLQKKKEFQPLFNRIARGVIQTQETGVLKGPALLGGVYSSPLTVVSFLDLLLTMAKDRQFEKSSVSVNGKNYSLGKGPLVMDADGKDLQVKADPYTVIRVDRVREMNLLDYTGNKPFFKVKIRGEKFRMGDETEMVVELDKDRDPTEYYAIVAVPSTLSVKQTADLLSDYKGQLIYGQRETGSQKIQLLAVPFRGSRQLVLKLGAAQEGVSDGYVMVRHISDPDGIATVRTGNVTVK